jgi:hypothetical protein
LCVNQITPRRSGPLQKSNVQLELGSNSRMAARYLTSAFETSEIISIVNAFSDVLRAHENIVVFAEKQL